MATRAVHAAISPVRKVDNLYYSLEEGALLG